MSSAADHRSQPAPRAAAGFTIIELVVVVLIIAIGSTYVFMGIEGFSMGSELRATARELASTVDFARNEAISLSEDLILEYDLLSEPQRYRVIVPYIQEADGKKRYSEEEGSDETELFSWRMVPRRMKILRILTPGNERVEDEVIRMRFSALGSTTAHIVHLTNLDAHEFALEVNPLTGIAQFYDYFKEFDTAEESDFATR